MKHPRRVAIVLLLIILPILGFLTLLSIPESSARPVNLALVTVPGGSTTTVHIADTWQEWYDANSQAQILTSAVSGAWLQLAPLSTTAAPTKGFILRIPVKLTANLPEGSFIDEGPAGLAACALFTIEVPQCSLTVVMYSVALTVSVNNQVIQVVNPGVLGNPTFISYQNKLGTQRDIDLFVWLQGSSLPDQALASNLMNSLCTGLCSIFNTNIFTNYVDLRSAVSQYQTTPFTVSVNIVEHYRAFQLYVTSALGTILGGSLGGNIVSYLTSPVSTVDVDNNANGPAWFWFTASSGLNGLPTGTFATFTAPTRFISVDQNGNVIAVVTATTTTTCGPGYCAGFNENGYTVTIWTNPEGPLQCLLMPSWLQWILCQSTYGIPNWLLLLLGVFVVIIIGGILVVAAKHRHRRGRRSSKRGSSRANRIQTVTVKIRK